MDQQLKPKEAAAIERCIRSFIIKSIHAIVQSRSGNAYTTSCISDVGARNNLMLYLEEDPEIGATIKQNLDSGFPIRTGDTFTLEILMNTSTTSTSLVVLEQWQFRINTEDALLRCGVPCSKVTANHSGLQPHMSSLPTNTTAGNLPQEADNNNSAALSVVAVEDLRRSRLFERLGTLLKTLIVTTRLLPAYNYSRAQQPEDDYKMCYTLRRRDSSPSCFGCGWVISRQVGHLFPGLAVPSSVSPNTLVPIYLNVSVRYLASIDSVSTNSPLINQPVAAISRGMRRMKVTQPVTQQNHWVRPAFATNYENLEEEEEESDPGVFLMRGRMDGTLSENEEEEEGGVYPDDALSSDSDDVIDEEEERDDGTRRTPPWPKNAFDESDEDEDDEMSRTFGRHPSSGKEAKGGAGDYGDDQNIPLQLPFSTVGISGARLTHLFAELRNKTDLDLFQVPSTTSALATSKSGRPALFDAEALADELERHEMTLREFDDFLADFTNVVPFVPVAQDQQTHHLRPRNDLASLRDLY